MAFFFAAFGNSAFNLLPKHFELSDFGPRTIGFIMGAAPIGGLVVLLPLMATIDRYRLRVVIALAVLLQILVTSLYLVPVRPPVLYAVPRFLQGSLTTATIVSFNAVVSRSATGDRRLQRFTLFGMMGPLGSLASVGIGEPIYDNSGLPALYLLAAGAFAGAVLLMSALRGRLADRRRPRQTSDSAADRGGETGRNRGLGQLRALFVAGFPYTVSFLILILGVAMGTVITFIPLVVLDAGLERIRPFFVAYPLAIIGVRVAMTGVLDRVPKHALVVAPLIGLPATLLLIPTVGSPAGLAAVGALYGLSHGILSPVLVSTFLSRASDAQQGRMSTVFQLLFNLGTFVAANAGGLLAEIHVHWTFIAAAGLALFASAAAVTRLRRLGIR